MKKLIFLLILAIFGGSQLTLAQGFSSSGGSSIGFASATNRVLAINNTLATGLPSKAYYRHATGRPTSPYCTISFKPTGRPPGMDWFVSRWPRHFTTAAIAISRVIPAVWALGWMAWLYNLQCSLLHRRLETAFNLIGGSYFRWRL